MKKILILAVFLVLLLITFTVINKNNNSNKFKIDKNVKIFLDQFDEKLYRTYLNEEETTNFIETIKHFDTQKIEELKANQNVSCAIVGNGANLLKNNYGNLIDSHDYVFRMNNSPISGYENHVGTKTNFRILHNWLKESVSNEINTVYILNIFAFYNDKKEVSGDLKEILFQLKKIPINDKADLARMPTNFLSFDKKILITHPDFLKYVMKSWFIAPKNNKFYEKAEWIVPSTGFVTVVMAFSLCNNIDIFGFSKPNADGVWEHYYEKSLRPVPTRHKADFQWELLLDLEKKAMLKIFK